MKRAIVPLGAMGMLGIVLFPLPAAALDLLLVGNLSFSMLLLLSVFYIAEPARFTSLPAVLLMSTLCRLALNISTTRLLLSVGEAPRVVRAFGEFVVGGDLLVGVVVFAMLTLVQFLVVAKGAERVAEVAARFTLDAMPGKQMAIDADIRSGILSVLDAKQRRADLQRESHLYGALDGAMKFVKGDAIAGILLIFVNVSAGLYIGMARRGLAMEAALHEYTLLTVGDGLLAQLPALLVAVAAGIAVTRVSGPVNDGGFGGELVAQLLHEPRPILFSALGLMLAAALPGIPLVPFLGMALLLVLGALLVAPGESARSQTPTSHGALDRRFEPRIASGLICAGGEPLVSNLRSAGRITELYAASKRELFERWGLIAPDLTFEFSANTPERVVAFSMRGAPLLQAVLDAHTPFAEAFSHLVDDVIAEHRSWLIDDTQVRLLLELYHPAHEDAINAVVPKLLTITALATLLRDLVEEGLSVRPFASILQAVAECPAENRSCRVTLAEFVRPFLARTISAKLSEDGRAIRIHLLSDGLQERLLTAIADGAMGEKVWLEPETRDLGSGSVRRALERNSALIVLCPSVIRRRVSELLRGTLLRNERERVFVVTPQELMPHFELEQIGTI